jgi:hypothetical protein
MADVSLKTSFSVHEGPKKLLEAPDILSDDFKKYLSWLVERRLSVPRREYFVNYNHYMTDRFLMAFGTGRSTPLPTDKDMEARVDLVLTREDERRLYSYLPVHREMYGKYFVPTVYEDEHTIRLILDLPGKIFVQSGHANDITEIGVFVGVPVGARSFKRKAFTWWWFDFEYTDYFFAHDEFSRTGIGVFETIKGVYGSTSSAYRYVTGVNVTLSYPYGGRTTTRSVPAVSIRRTFAHSATYNLVLVKVLVARIVLPTPLSIESGYIYSFRYTIYKT